ncbi:MAG: translation initiation factor IF-2 subunit beta [Candidatus Heimdallarchaeota archaeon]|nr:translation initiation factor IF-2 subunit beta [Candidatus Heimdallarchaeota archaeon]
MATFDYNKLLKNVQDNISSDRSNEDRFKLPQAEIFYEGNTTVIKNFDKISDAVNRDPEKILKFLLGGLGTAGERYSGRVIFQGKIPTVSIQSKLKDYIETFVICSECGKPDTHLVKKGRTLIVRCDACGGFRPVKSRKKKLDKPASLNLVEGMKCDVTIKDIGKKGDGVAYIDKYIVYVPEAVKGSTVQIKIEKISGTVAFSSIV